MSVVPHEYVLELMPGWTDQEAAQHGVCGQDCPHCPLSSKRRPGRNGKLSLNSDVTVALAQTVQRLELSGEVFNRLSLFSGLEETGSGPLIERPLNLFSNPGELALGLGDLKLGTEENDYKDILREFDRRLPIRYFFPYAKSRVHIGYRVPLERDLAYTQAGFDEAVKMGRGAIEAVRNYSGTSPIDISSLRLLEAINAHPKSQKSVLSNEKTIADKKEQVHALIDEILGETINSDTPITIGHHVQENALFIEASCDSDEFRFSYNLRIVGQDAATEPIDLSVKPAVLGIGFSPDRVWVHHHTHYVNDTSLFFTYADYLKVLDEAADKELSLQEAFFEEIARRRLKARR